MTSKIQNRIYVDKNMTVWSVNHQLHRLDGPAFITSLEEEWFIWGQPYRKYGPTKTYRDYSLYSEWYEEWTNDTDADEGLKPYYIDSYHTKWNTKNGLMSESYTGERQYRKKK